MDCISLWTQQIYNKTFQKWTRKKFSFIRKKIVASIMKKLLSFADQADGNASK